MGQFPGIFTYSMGGHLYPCSGLVGRISINVIGPSPVASHTNRSDNKLCSANGSVLPAGFFIVHYMPTSILSTVEQ